MRTVARFSSEALIRKLLTWLAKKCCVVTRNLIHPADSPTPLHVLSDAEKNELLLAQHEMIERMAARISEFEALVGKPRKSSSNSHIPPSKDDFGKKGGKGRKPKTTKRPPREGKHRPLAETPDKTERVIASACNHCGTDVSGQTQQCRQRYDHVDLPPIQPVVTRVELWGGRCRCCKRLYKAQAPEGMAPGSPFGPLLTRPPLI